MRWWAITPTTPNYITKIKIFMGQWAITPASPPSYDCTHSSILQRGGQATSGGPGPHTNTIPHTHKKCEVGGDWTCPVVIGNSVHLELLFPLRLVAILETNKLKLLSFSFMKNRQEGNRGHQPLSCAWFLAWFLSFSIDLCRSFFVYTASESTYGIKATQYY